MPVRTILVKDKKMKQKINRLARKYNLSALVRQEILKQFGNERIIDDIDIKRVHGRRGGMLVGDRMNIYLDKKTDSILRNIQRGGEKINFSKFCREIFRSFN
jgi:ABC-type transport system involved in Fe-S cluster assembly fused permease/ATPase subunit